MSTEKKAFTPEVFQFSSEKHEVRSLLLKDEPWLVAKDVCEILGLSDTNMALRNLDDDEKLTQKIFGSGQSRKMWLINESGFFALVLRSNKPEAKSFRKWVTSEVLPAIRKKGYYGMPQKQSDFSDLRDVPYQQTEFNGVPIRHIQMDGEMWFSMNDIHRAIGSSTESTQAARKLNKKQTLARKILLFGNTAPAWFTNQLGFQLLLSGSRMSLSTRQLELNFGGQA
jgi:prophage antirepressor-like protein